MAGANKPSLLERVVALGYATTEARSLILAGRVLVDGQTESRVGVRPRADAIVEVRPVRRYPSRAGEKLAGAIADFRPALAARAALDLGAAHGGFCACLLEHGVRRVYAVDVAYGILDYDLRSDSRVVVLERTHVRDLEPGLFQDHDLTVMPGLFIVCDLSFISMRSALQAVVHLRQAAGSMAEWSGLFMVKPQFEDSRALENGVLRDPHRREAAICGVLEQAERLGYLILGRAPSRLKGQSGNEEEFLYLALPAPADSSSGNDRIVAAGSH
ncbi:MAG: hypothetical protein K1X75_03710 [Leptospirales bacterium]|nr:hypothetical protein [Leptospirales bacterium]